jgi:uncharacterized protein DUF6678
MTEVHPVMNNTKWDELRLAMYAMERSLSFRCMTLSDYYSASDAEWFYHFRAGGYDDIRYVDIFAESPSQRDQIGHALRKIHVPGEETETGFRVYGYALPEPLNGRACAR